VASQSLSSADADASGSIIGETRVATGATAVAVVVAAVAVVAAAVACNGNNAVRPGSSVAANSRMRQRLCPRRAAATAAAAGVTGPGETPGCL
jgi:hypothetical protein